MRTFAKTFFTAAIIAAFATSAQAQVCTGSGLYRSCAATSPNDTLTQANRYSRTARNWQQPGQTFDKPSFDTQLVTSKSVQNSKAYGKFNQTYNGVTQSPNYNAINQPLQNSRVPQ